MLTILLEILFLRTPSPLLDLIVLCQKLLEDFELVALGIGMVGLLPAMRRGGIQIPSLIII